MRITETDSRLVLRDVPGVLWVFGLVFMASGLFVLSVPLWAPEWRGFRWWERLAILVIGSGHVAGGLLTTNQVRATVTSFDRTVGRGTQRIHRLWTRWWVAHRNAPTEFSLADARAVEIVQSKDDEGDPMYRLRLWLAGSEWLWLQSQPVYGGPAMHEAAGRVRRFLRLDAPPLAG